MPGPPECECATSKTGLTVYTLRCQRHSPFSAAHLALRPSKRLTGTECAAEFWSVWRNILRYDHGDPDRGEAIQQANTWLRFATHPHALEEA